MMIRRDGSPEAESDIRWLDSCKVEIFTLKGALSPANIISYSLEYKILRFSEDESTQQIVSISKAVDSGKDRMEFSTASGIPKVVEDKHKDMAILAYNKLKVSIIAEGGYEATKEYMLVCLVSTDVTRIRENPKRGIFMMLVDGKSWEEKLGTAL